MAGLCLGVVGFYVLNFFAADLLLWLSTPFDGGYEKLASLGVIVLYGAMLMVTFSAALWVVEKKTPLAVLRGK